MLGDEFKADEKKNRNLKKDGQSYNGTSDHTFSFRHNLPNYSALDGYYNHGEEDDPADATEKFDTAPHRCEIRIASNRNTKLNKSESFDSELFHRLSTQRFNLLSSRQPPTVRSISPLLHHEKGALPSSTKNLQAKSMSSHPLQFKSTQQATPLDNRIPSKVTTAAKQELRLLGSRYASSALSSTSKNISNVSNIEGHGADHSSSEFPYSKSFTFDRSVSLLSTDSHWHTANTSVESAAESIPNDDVDNDSSSSFHKSNRSNDVGDCCVTRKGAERDKCISLPFEGFGGNYLMHLSHIARESSNLESMESTFTSRGEDAAIDNFNTNNDGECSSSCMSCLSSQTSIKPCHISNSLTSDCHGKIKCDGDCEENCKPPILIGNEKKATSGEGDYFSFFCKAQQIFSTIDFETSANELSRSESSQHELQGHRNLDRFLLDKEGTIDDPNQTAKIGGPQPLVPSIATLISFEKINPFFIFFFGSSLVLIIMVYDKHASDEFRRSLTEMPLLIRHSYFNNYSVGGLQRLRLLLPSKPADLSISKYVTNFTSIVSNWANGIEEIDITSLVLKSLYRIAKIYFDVSQQIDSTRKEMTSWTLIVTDVVDSAWATVKVDALDRFSSTTQQLLIDWKKIWSTILLWQYSLEKHSDLPKRNSAASIVYPPIPDWRMSSTAPFNLSIIASDDLPERSHPNLPIIAQCTCNQTCLLTNQVFGETGSVSFPFNTGCQRIFWISRIRTTPFLIRHDNFHRHIHSIPSFNETPDWHIADTQPVHDQQVHTKRDFQPVIIGIGESRLALDKDNDALVYIHEQLVAAITKHKDEKRKKKQEMSSAKEDIRKKYTSLYHIDKHTKMEEEDAFAGVSMMDMASDVIGSMISKSRKKVLHNRIDKFPNNDSK